MSDSNFIITLTTILLGGFALLVKYCFKSKCSDINICFGLLQIKRDVADETKIEQIKIEHNINDDDIEKQPIK